MNTTPAPSGWRQVLIAALALVIVAAGPSVSHEAKCPVCKLDVVQDTETLDHEVILRSGRKRIEYRCVACALGDSVGYQGDLTILAPSELKGKPVMLTRKAGTWSFLPESAVFLAEKADHRSCQLGFRALTTKAALKGWQQGHVAVVATGRLLPLPQFLEAATAHVASNVPAPAVTSPK